MSTTRSSPFVNNTHGKHHPACSGWLIAMNCVTIEDENRQSTTNFPENISL